MCAGIHRYTLCMASRLRTSPHFSRHLRSQTLTHALKVILSAHMYSLCHSEPPSCHSERQRRICCFPQISFSRSFYPTCVQASIDIRFVWHPPHALLSISPDICADNPPPTPYFQLSLHTSQLPNRHPRSQTLTHALKVILPAHFCALLPTSAQPILDSRPEWHPPRAHVLSLSPKTPFCHSEPPSCHSE